MPNCILCLSGTYCTKCSSTKFLDSANIGCLTDCVQEDTNS